MHVFDTDVNTLSKLIIFESLRHKRVLVKRPGSILQEIQQSQSGFLDPTILDKPLTEGAGQLRVISRLALRAMKEDKLTSFGKKLRKFFRLQVIKQNMVCVSL